MTHPESHRPRTAVIGSGVSGLTASWILQRDQDVTLYEADDRVGGHADTHDVIDGSGSRLAVDTGFIVHNERTYPFLLRLFSELGVRTQESDMSMSVHCDECGLEYAGARGLAGLFPTPAAAMNPRYLALLAHVPRFHRQARALLADGADDDTTLAEFAANHRFSPYFVRHFLTPLVSAVWSCPADAASQYPARYLFSFLEHHGMLSVTGSPQWRTVTGGSRSYVELVTKNLSAVHTSTPVRSVQRHADGVDVVDDAGHTTSYDSVVVATHPDQALRMIADPTPVQVSTLGAFRYSHNETLLHSDSSLLPTAARAHASWNYRMASCRDTADRVRVTYDMNRLQRLDTATSYLVTLGGHGRVNPDLIVDRMSYQHPTYTAASVAAQRRLPTLNDSRLAFAGAYHGWGFHEDGARAGVAAAASLGVTW